MCCVVGCAGLLDVVAWHVELLALCVWLVVSVCDWWLVWGDGCDWGDRCCFGVGMWKTGVGACGLGLVRQWLGW